jgi:hypothetical protein
MTFDPVNKPSHYTEGRKFETIEVIEDWDLGFCLGNAVKYISRAGRKVNLVEDLKKARWYIDRQLAALEEQPEQPADIYDQVCQFLTEEEEDAWAHIARNQDSDVLWDPTLGPIEEDNFEYVVNPWTVNGSLYDNPYS